MFQAEMLLTDAFHHVVERDLVVPIKGITVRVDREYRGNKRHGQLFLISTSKNCVNV